MERKTQVHAPEGQQDIWITREFNLPVDLLFKAYTEPELLAEWMGTTVVKLENKAHGGYELKTSDAEGNVLFHAHGSLHEWIPNQKIVRTFEMTNAGIDAQLEFLNFEALSPSTSKLSIQIVYRSAAHRERQLKLPFAWGINMAHDRLEEVLSTKK